MYYADIIPENLMRELLEMLEEKLQQYSIIGQNFIIQYTYFEYELFMEIIDPDTNNLSICTGVQNNNDEPDSWCDQTNCLLGRWVMKNFLDIGNETLKKIYLTISHNNMTKIAIYAKNPKFGILRIDKKLDMRNKSVFDRIYACDLYLDFKPLHYYGKCYTS